MPDLYLWSAIALIALVTAGIRFMPFLIFRKDQKTPALINRLGKVLPYSVMGMLVVYCLKDVSFSSAAGWLPALIASLTVSILYLWKRNTLISILCGTICYMLLVQQIF